MLRLPDRVRLRNLISGVDDLAKIVELTPSMARLKIDRRWWDAEGVDHRRLEMEPDAAWRNWASIAMRAQEVSDFACLACLTADREIQGAILYSKYGKSLADPAIGAVEGMLLATAPRNRNGLTDSPKYRGVGSALLFHAVVHSFILGYEGRMVIESKAHPDTFRFYLNRGFVSRSIIVDDKIKMDLSSEAATEWLRSRGMTL